MPTDTSVISPDDLVLVTGASGFIGRRVVERLLVRGYRNLRCLCRPSGNSGAIEAIARRHEPTAAVSVMRGNLLSRDDCERATADAAVVYHLAAGRGDMFADAFLNSAVATRNLLLSVVKHGCLRRFVNVSSFSVYSNTNKPRGRLLDESCPVEAEPWKRADPYMFGKAKQDQIVSEYAGRFGIPCVTVRPGCVYGRGNESITNRVGIATFGVFLHMGGGNRVPLTYVDNCADAIVLAGVTPGIDGEVFNVVDDDLPSSRRFLRLYKRHVKRFASFYVPHAVSYVLCCAWERYSAWSEGQLPPAFNSRGWHAYWKKTDYTNTRLKDRLGWKQIVPPAEALSRYFEACREKANHA